VNRWLIKRGMMFIQVDVGDVGMADDQFHEMGGPSPREGVYHSVVGKGGKMVHDPHQSRAGLKAAETWGFIIPHNPALNAP